MSKGHFNLKSKVKTANVETTTKSPVGLQVLWLIDGHSFKAGALKWCIDLIQSGCMEKKSDGNNEYEIRYCGVHMQLLWTG